MAEVRANRVANLTVGVAGAENRRPMFVLDTIALLSLAGLILVWGLYPAAVGLLALLRRRGGSGVVLEWPRVSVVIATREPAEAVRERVRNGLSTRYPPDRLEIIVAHDREGVAPDLSDLRPAEAVRTVAADPGGGKAVALNAGVRSATGDVIVFADTYQRFEEDTIPLLVTKLMEPKIGAVSGSLQLSSGTGPMVSLYWKLERWLRGAEARLHSAVGATGAVWAMRRSLWNELPAGLILDDVYTPMRVALAGQRVAFIDSARAWEMRTPTPTQEYGRKVRTLTGVVQLCHWLPEVLSPIRNPIWLQFLFHKLLRLTTPYMVTFIGIWVIVRPAASATPATLLLAGGAAVVGLAWLMSTHRPLAVRLRRLALESFLIQYAVLVAGVNGLRGNWQVWDA